MALLNRVTIEQQVAILAEIGNTVNDGVAVDDLIEFEDREKLELQPYAGLVEALGYEIERKPFTPKCNRLWMCDYERIEDHGDYKAVLERLELMTDCALGLRDIKDYVDIEDDCATSTEQCARAATADETLPSRKRSIRPIPLAPTKMQSAPQLSASAISNRFGSSSFTTASVFNAAARSLSAASPIIFNNDQRLRPHKNLNASASFSMRGVDR